MKIICVGASAGGLEALRAFVSVLPADFSHPVIVAQHLSPTHRSLLAPLIEKNAKIKVTEAHDGQRLLGGTIYVVPELADVVIDGHVLRLEPTTSRKGPHPSVNRLFETAAKSHGKNTIGVILSGTGSDGTLGAAVIDDAGGIVFAQDADSAKYWGMPKSVIDKSLASAILPPEMIAKAVVEFTDSGRLPSAESEAIGNEAFGRIALSLERRLDFGIGSYKQPTVLRRLGARIAATNCTTVEEYAALLDRNSDEGQHLINALLIPVTSFFRDEEAFGDLSKELRKYTSTLDGSAPMRIWVPGCCTGEEAYSIAILLSEIAETAGRAIPFQIFATDMSESFISTARRGIYQADSVDGLKDELLRKYFDIVPTGYRVADRVRERVIFAKHDIIRSTPFMHVDLVSCRNLLIYFKNEAQQAALNSIATALKPGGILFLGRSETIGDQTAMFGELSRKSRIFGRKDVRALRGKHTRSNDTLRFERQINRPTGRQVAGPPNDAERLVALLITDGNPTFLIDSKDAVLQVAGSTKDVVSIAPGPPPRNIYEFVDSGFTVDLRSAVLACRREKAERISRRLEIERAGTVNSWRVVARPVFGDDGSDTVLVIFEPAREKSTVKKQTEQNQQLVENTGNKRGQVSVGSTGIKKGQFC